MRQNSQTPNIYPSQAQPIYQPYYSSTFKGSSSQPNFFPVQQSTPKATILMNPFNQIYHSRNIPNNIQNIQNIQNRTPQKSQKPMQTQSESKFIKSYNSNFLKEKVETGSNHWKNLLDDEKYLVNLENKMRVLLQENDKLLGLVEEKTRELREYQEIERKIHAILAENARLNDILIAKEKENQGSLASQQNQIIEKQNEQIEHLLNHCEELKSFEEENQAFRQREIEFQQKISDISYENEAFLKKSEEKNEEIEFYKENLEEKDEKIRILEDHLKSLVEENEKFRKFFEEKQEENRLKLDLLITNNTNLNSLIEDLSNEKQKNFEEKSLEISKNEEFQKKLLNLFEINERMNEILQEEMKTKQENMLILSKIELLIETNQSLEQAYHEKMEENQKFKGLYEEFREKFEGKDEKSIQMQTSVEEIEILMGQFEALKRENIELYEKNEEFSRYQQDFNALLEENKRINDNLKEKDLYLKELEMRNEEIYNELMKETQINQDIKAEIERVLLEKEEISGSLHEKCMLLLEENNKLQEITQNKEQEINGCTIRISEMEEEIEEKIATLKEYQEKNENICQEFTVLKEEFESHGLNSNKEIDRNLEDNLLKLQKEIEMLKTQNNHWKIMNETRDKEIVKLYDLLKARKQENLAVLKENQQLKDELSRFKGGALNGNGESGINKDQLAEINEKLMEEIKGMKEIFENNLISLEYYKGEYENSMKLIEEMKAANAGEN